MPFKPNKNDSEINQKYYRVCGNKTIAKTKVQGEERYEIWQDKEYLGFEKTFNEAVNSEKWK